MKIALAGLPGLLLFWVAYAWENHWNFLGNFSNVYMNGWGFWLSAILGGFALATSVLTMVSVSDPW